MTDDMKSWSIMHLLCVGGRMTNDFDEESAVKMYLNLHPDANEAQVRAELSRELAKEGEVWPAPNSEMK